MNGTIRGGIGAVVGSSTAVSKGKTLLNPSAFIVFVLVAGCEVPSEPWFQLGPNAPNCLWNGSPPSQCCAVRETERCGFRELESCICQKNEAAVTLHGIILACPWSNTAYLITALKRWPANLARYPVERCFPERTLEAANRMFRKFRWNLIDIRGTTSRLG